MRSIFTVILLPLLLIKQGYNEDSISKASLQRIYVDDDSQLYIHGTTNINKFHCRYSEDLPDTITLEVIQDNKHWLSLEQARFSLKVRQFDCGNKMINKDFRELLGANQYPELVIEALGIFNSHYSMPDSLIALESRDSLKAHLKVNIAGRSNEYMINVSQDKRNSEIHTGSLKVSIRDFGLTPPTKMLGLMQVSEFVNIDFYLKFRPIN